MIVDGTSGLVIIDPDLETLADYAARRDPWSRAAAAVALIGQPGLTRDEVKIAPAVNLVAAGGEDRGGDRRRGRPAPSSSS